LIPSISIRKAAPLACLLVAGAASAQQTLFYPSVTLDAAYSDNVLYAGAANEPVSDGSARVGVVLPLRREWDRGAWNFEYNPSYEKHEDLSQLDHAEHRLATHVSQKAGRSGVFGFGATFTRTQEQGRAWSLESPDLFLTNRTNRHFVSAELGFAQDVSPRWRWAGGLWAGWYDYSVIEDLSAGVPAAAVEDRNEYRGNVLLSRSLTRASSMGAQYEHRRFDLETGGTEDADLVSITFDHAASRDLTLSAKVGGYTRSVQDPAPGAPDEPLDTGAQGGFTLKRAFRSTTLSLDAGVAPTSGGALEGTSLDSSVGVTLGSIAGLRWSWTVAARFAHRDPTDPAEENVGSVGGDFDVEWRPTEKLGFRVGAAYADQSGDDPSLDASYTTATAGLVWYPRGYPRESVGVPREGYPRETTGTAGRIP